MSSVAVDEVCSRVLRSRRYGTLAPQVVARLAAEEAPKSRNLAEAEKRTKRRLHQIAGAYATDPDYDLLLADLRAARDDPAAFRDACLVALRRHASTRERLPALERVYAEIFAATGPPGVLLDVGCGLNPLALPWMGLPAGCRYLACDIDTALLAFVDAFLTLAGRPHETFVCDVVAGVPAVTCDVVLLLKAVPCLEQQRAGVTLDLLRGLRARHIVVSFPTRSLGGRGKGMAHNYRALFTAMLAEAELEATELAVEGELVFVVPTGEVR